MALVALAAFDVLHAARLPSSRPSRTEFSHGLERFCYVESFAQRRRLGSTDGMSPHKTIKTSTMVGGVSLAVACLFAWVMVVGLMSDMNGGDLAGTAMARAFTAFWAFGLYALLTALALLAAFGGDMPDSGRIALAIAVPVSGAAVAAAFNLLRQPELPPGLWPLVIPAGMPPLLVLYCLWGLTPLRGIVPPNFALISVCAGTGLLCVALAPMQAVRTQRDDAVAAIDADWEAKFLATPDDAPIEQWRMFLHCGAYKVEDAARLMITSLEGPQGNLQVWLDSALRFGMHPVQKRVAIFGARRLPNRIADAVEWFKYNNDDWGRVEARYYWKSLLPEFDIEVTPAICASGMGWVDRMLASIQRGAQAGQVIDPTFGGEQSSVLVVLTWLARGGCDADARVTKAEGMLHSSGTLGSATVLATLAALHRK